MKRLDEQVVANLLRTFHSIGVITPAKLHGLIDTLQIRLWIKHTKL